MPHPPESSLINSPDCSSSHFLAQWPGSATCSNSYLMDDFSFFCAFAPPSFCLFYFLFLLFLEILTNVDKDVNMSFISILWYFSCFNHINSS